jgi:branched-chain amino acid transport system substrate-binding protein
MVRQRSLGHNRIALAAVIVVSVVLSAACGTSGGSGGSGGTKEIVIGEVASLTGAYSILGGADAGGIKTAVDQLNQAGGVVVAGTRYRFRVVVADDQSDPTQAGLVTQQLIQNNGVKFIFGPDETPEFNASIPITNKAGVIQTSISFIAGTDLAQHGAVAPYNYAFAADLSTTVASDGTIKGITDLWPGLKTAVILFPSDASYDPEVSALKAALHSSGITLRDTLRFDSATNDYSPFLTKIKAESPDVVVAGAQATQNLAITRQASELGGVAGHILMMGGEGGQTLSLNNGRGVGFPTAWFTVGGFDRYAHVPAFTAYIRNYKAANGKEPPAADYVSSAYYYAPIFQLAKAMETAGTIDDTAKISRVMVSTSVPGIVGTFKYNQHHLAQIPLSVCEALPNAAGAQATKCVTVKSSS